MSKSFFLNAIAKDKNQPNRPEVEISEVITLVDKELDDIMHFSASKAFAAHNARHPYKLDDNWNLTIRTFNAI